MTLLNLAFVLTSDGQFDRPLPACDQTSRLRRTSFLWESCRFHIRLLRRSTTHIRSQLRVLSQRTDECSKRRSRLVKSSRVGRSPSFNAGFLPAGVAFYDQAKSHAARCRIHCVDPRRFGLIAAHLQAFHTRQEDNHQPKEITMPQDIAEFRIIGRVAKVTKRENVTYVSVAANYNRKDGDEWKTDTHWNEVTLFDRQADRLKAETGDLVHITGRVRQNEYKKGNETIHSVALIAQSLSILARKGEAAEGQSDHDVDEDIPF